MARHLTWTPQSGQASAGLFPDAISANSVYDLGSIMDEPFDIRSGVDPIRAATLIHSGAQTSALSSLGLLTSNGVSGLAANEMGVVSGNGYEIAVGQTVVGDAPAGDAFQIEIEYDERGTVERPL